MTVSDREFSELKSRIRKAEEDVVTLKTAQAVTAVQNQSVLNRLDNIDGDVKGMKGGINKLIWLVATAIIGGLATSIEWGWKVAG